jgi:hypothetical protein
MLQGGTAPLEGVIRRTRAEQLRGYGASQRDPAGYRREGRDTYQNRATLRPAFAPLPFFVRS